MVWYVWFVVLKAVLFREDDLWELWSRSLLHIGLEVCEVHGCLLPRSIPTIGHLLPFEVWSNLCRSRKALSCLLIVSLYVDLHPPRIHVLLIDEWHFVHMSVGPCFLLHLCT